MNNLKYFTSVRLPEDDKTHSTFSDIEDLLQQEHDSSGKHPIATDAQSGFISAQDFQRLNRMWEWFQQQMNK